MSRADGQPIEVLHVDDEPDFGELVGTYLERHNDAISVDAATSARDGLEILDEESIDCIVSDHDMPGMDGLDFLRVVREEYPELPFVLFTGKGNEEIASDAISAGVTEYLQKGTGTDQYAVLANRIERAVEEYRAKHALEESERMLSTLISNLPGMAYRCRNDRGWPMEFVSEGCRDLTGYDPDALVDGNVIWGEDVLIEADREQLWETVQAVLDAGDPFEITYRLETATGTEKRVWERGQAVYDDGELVAIEGIILDLDGRLIGIEDLDEDPSRRDMGGYERVLERVDDGFLAVDEEWTITYVNSHAQQLVDREADSLIGTSLWEAFPDAVGSTFEEEYTEAMDNQEPITFTAEYDPLEKWFEVRAYPAPDGLSIYFRDVTDHHQREQELERYRILVENVGDPMHILEPDGTIQMVNQAMADHLGYDREEIVGSPTSKFMPEADVEKGGEIIQELLDSDRTWATFEMETIHADGSRTVNEDKVAVLTDDGEFIGSVGVIRDISERKERERELERYETIIQAVDDPVYALDEAGRFTFVNDAAESLTGYSPAELIGEDTRKIVPEPDFKEGLETVQELIEDPDLTHATYEIDLRTKDGKTIPAENHLALLPEENGFSGTAGVIRDISERKQRERRLEEFASVVSHDLQSPLNVINGRAELALETGELAHVEDIVEATGQMEALIDDLLMLAREGETIGDRSEVDLGRVAEDAWEQVETGESTLDLSTDATIKADPDRLRELLANLFANAVDHGGAAVTVEVGDFENGFYVADDGTGIPPEEQDHVFEHGYSTSEEGTGLGLTIVERIANAHGWDVTVTESAEGGARFEIRI